MYSVARPAVSRCARARACVLCIAGNLLANWNVNACQRVTFVDDIRVLCVVTRLSRHVTSLAAPDSDPELTDENREGRIFELYFYCTLLLY